MCVWGLETGEKARVRRAFSRVSRRIHILTYMLRQCTCIVFILQFQIVNKRLLDDDKSIWNNFVYVFENNIPRCAPMSLLYVLFIKDEVLITVSCPIFPSILIAKYLFTGSLKNRSIDNLETQKKYISMKNSQFFNDLLYAKSK